MKAILDANKRQCCKLYVTLVEIKKLSKKIFTKPFEMKQLTFTTYLVGGEKHVNSPIIHLTT